MPRRKVVYVERPRNTVIVLYGSLFLLLLTFFVVLASMSVRDVQKQKMAIGSIMGSFGVLPGGRSPFTMDILKNILPQGPSVETGPVNIRNIEDTLNGTGAVTSVAVSQGKLGVIISIKAGILFEGETDTLSPESRAVLAAVARILSRIDNKVIVMGHTDSIPIEKAPFFSNWGLSAARALAVLSYLEDNGIPGERLSAYGMGSSRPLATNATQDGRRLNRRVEIVITGDLPGEVTLDDIRQSRVDWRRSFFYKGFNFELEEQ